ncbi:MAG: hypothetical protein R3B70_19775 [Polyangiaceae bacterium]
MSFSRCLSISLVALSLATAVGCKKDKEDIYYGDDSAFEGMNAGAAAHGIDNAAPHDPSEPEVFDAGWVGMESYQVLNAAKRGEIVYSQARMSNGMYCTLFHGQNDRLVRRIVIGSGRQNDPTQEATFAASGNMVLWFRSDRKPKPTLDWAYFHRNSTLALYQVKRPGGARGTFAAPAGLANQIYTSVRDCLTSYGAENPPAGVYSGPGANEDGPEVDPLAQPVQPPSPAPVPVPAPAPVPAANSGARSESGGGPVRVTFRNDRNDQVRVLWVDYQGNEKPYAWIPANHAYSVDTYVKHAWVVRDSSGGTVTRFVPKTGGSLMLPIR